MLEYWCFEFQVPQAHYIPLVLSDRHTVNNTEANP